MKAHAVTTDYKREEGLVQPLNSGTPGAGVIDGNFNMQSPDANVFKALLQGNGISMAVSLPDQLTTYKSPVIPEGPVGQALEIEVGILSMGL
jgi:hypothetical protein